VRRIAAILKRLAEIDKTLLEHDSVLRTIWTKLQPLLAPLPEACALPTSWWTVPLNPVGIHRAFDFEL
jgi:hypothetical protein